MVYKFCILIILFALTACTPPSNNNSNNNSRGNNISATNTIAANNNGITRPTATITSGSSNNPVTQAIPTITRAPNNESGNVTLSESEMEAMGETGLLALMNHDFVIAEDLLCEEMIEPFRDSSSSIAIEVNVSCELDGEILNCQVSTNTSSLEYTLHLRNGKMCFTDIP